MILWHLWIQGWAILSLVYRISYSRIIWQISYIGDIKAISWYFIRYFWSNSPITLESWGNKTKQTVLEFLTPTNKFKKNNILFSQKATTWDIIYLASIAKQWQGLLGKINCSWKQKLAAHAHPGQHSPHSCWALLFFDQPVLLYLCPVLTNLITFCEQSTCQLEKFHGRNAMVKQTSI